MHIALLSYEYPPDTAYGGIGTYTAQAAACLQQLGCRVEVFSSSPARTVLNQLSANGVIVHRIQTDKREVFREQIAGLVKQRHQQMPFDIIEGPDYGAESIRIKQLLPEVPLIIKFHTPSFLIKQLNHSVKKDRLKYRMKRALGIGRYHYASDPEYIAATRADALVSPCHSLKDIIHTNWPIAKEASTVIPYPFIAGKPFLAIPATTNTNYITYIGRLETRKGVHLLAQAIPGVMEKFPEARFRFIGRTNIGPYGKGTMLGYLKEKLSDMEDKVAFIDNVPLAEIPYWLQQTDICIFPSLWENFPNVCLEAMSAARGIIASQNGGMYDMLHDISDKLLVDPYAVKEIEKRLLDLLQNPERRIALAEQCRRKITQYYAAEVPRQLLTFYQHVIQTKKLPWQTL